MADRHQPLCDWLDRNHARLLWHSHSDDEHIVVRAYSINGRLAVVLEYQDRDGWELLVPASPENNIAATLDAAAQSLGCLGCRDLVRGGAAETRRSTP